MSDWSILTEELLGFTNDFRDCLRAFRQQAIDLAERDRVQILEAQAEEWGTHIAEVQDGYAACLLSARISAEDEPIFANLQEKLQAAKIHIGRLHGYYDLGYVRLAVVDVDQLVRLFLSTGPHGPGGGRPPRRRQPGRSR